MKETSSWDDQPYFINNFLYIKSVENNHQYRFSAFWLRSKCSICSYQLNIWYVPHWGTSILNWFLVLGEMSGACSALATGWPGIAVPPGSAHFPLGKKTTKQEELLSEHKGSLAWSMLYIPVDNLQPCWDISLFFNMRIKCLAQGNNTVPLEML